MIRFGSIMRKVLGATTVAFAIAVLTVSSVAAFSGPQTSAATCGAGKLVINVTYKVVNDVDSGVAGNYWARDSYNRHIQVWETAPGTFCATVDYDGKFVTNAGASPQNTGTVSANVTGNFNGGYSATITGALNTSPAWSTRGNLGTIDYQCDNLGNCPGYVSFVDTYFTGATFTYTWWGWQYKAAQHGTWVNSSDGNSGDITG